MKNLLKGWRRKIGVAALLLVSVVLCVWIRSQFVSDLVSWQGSNTDNCFFSTKRSLVWQRSHVIDRSAGSNSVRIANVTETVVSEADVDGKLVVIENVVEKPVVVNESVAYENWQTFPASDGGEHEDYPGFNWLWRWGGFGVCEFKEATDEPETFVTFLHVPFWLLVIPLTVISASLLLIKPK